MKRSHRIAVIVMTALIALIALLPLSVALPLALPLDAGVTARRATGTIWAGRLHAARVAGFAVGDTDVALRLGALFLGEAQAVFRSPALSGAVHAASGVRGASNLVGAIDLAGRFAPLPLARIEFDGVTAAFRNGRCVRAEGRVRAQVAGEFGGVALPGGLGGTIRCDGAAIVLPLVGQSGLERLTLRMTESGKWRGEIAIRSSDPATAARLLGMGFTAGSGGATLRLLGQL